MSEEHYDQIERRARRRGAFTIVLLAVLGLVALTLVVLALIRPA